MVEDDKNKPNTKTLSDENPVRDRTFPHDENRIESPANFLEIDDGNEGGKRIGDDEAGLDNSIEKQHEQAIASKEYDGIRDGDREANDEIGGEGNENDEIYGDEIHTG